jgi:hypothetical protein
MRRWLESLRIRSALLLREGGEGVTELVGKDDGRLLWRWLALIFLKAHIKHRDLRWHLNRTLGEVRIADT